LNLKNKTGKLKTITTLCELQYVAWRGMLSTECPLVNTAYIIVSTPVVWFMSKRSYSSRVRIAKLYTVLSSTFHDDNICETRFSMLCPSCLELTTSVVTLLQFLSLGLRHSSSLRLSLLSLLTNTLPGPSASEVTTLRRYTNLFIIIIIVSTIVYFLTLTP